MRNLAFLGLGDYKASSIYSATKYSWTLRNLEVWCNNDDKAGTLIYRLRLSLNAPIRQRTLPVSPGTGPHLSRLASSASSWRCNSLSTFFLSWARLTFLSLDSKNSRSRSHRLNDSTKSLSRSSLHASRSRWMSHFCAFSYFAWSKLRPIWTMDKNIAQQNRRPNWILYRNVKGHNVKTDDVRLIIGEKVESWSRLCGFLADILWVATYWRKLACMCFYIKMQLKASFQNRPAVFLKWWKRRIPPCKLNHIIHVRRVCASARRIMWEYFKIWTERNYSILSAHTTGDKLHSKFKMHVLRRHFFSLSKLLQSYTSIIDMLVDLQETAHFLHCWKKIES